MRTRTASLWILSITTLAAWVATAGAQSLPYYIANGDGNIVYIVQNGVLQGSFPTSGVSMGYALAVRSTVVVGGRDDTGAVEYTLAGVPTGNSYPGGSNFSQLLDGTTDGVAYNYGVECCGSPNSVTRADLFWQGQAVLFDLPDAASGIAYDLADATLWVALYDETVRHYTLAGTELSQFSPAFGQAVGLAYDSSSDTLWMKSNQGATIYQYSKAGAQLAALTIPGFSPGNDWGGEMPMGGGAAPPREIPATGALGGALLAAALLGLGLLSLRRPV
jgi:hypothetical protein